MNMWRGGPSFLDSRSGYVLTKSDGITSFSETVISVSLFSIAASGMSGFRGRRRGIVVPERGRVLGQPNETWTELYKSYSAASFAVQSHNPSTQTQLRQVCLTEIVRRARQESMAEGAAGAHA